MEEYKKCTGGSGKMTLRPVKEPIPAGYNCEMVVTEYFLQKFRELFEIEILQGAVQELPNGMFHVLMNLSPEDIDQLSKAIHKNFTENVPPQSLN